MKRTLYSLSLLILFGISFMTFGGKPVEFSIVPQPEFIHEGHSKFRISESTRIIIDSGSDVLKKLADSLSGKISASHGFGLAIDESNSAKSKNTITLSLSKTDTSIGKEGYELIVTKKKIIIRANAPNGIFYGLQSLYQLLPPSIEARTLEYGRFISVPSVYIKDKPRFSYRGMHLDVCRHMFPPEAIKKYIDVMAMYKMNTFHWHLTDDQGWRIEIKKYPLLTRLGSMRSGTQIGHTDSIDNKPYGGFYTQEEARSIVRYAADHFITVIPEIEMPGHSVAALTAYPQYSCTGGPFEVMKIWGVSDDIFCAGNDSTFAFLGDILTEIMAVFPSTFIHIGGDEAPKVRWEQCPKCQARIKTEGLKNEVELQSYFTKRIERFLESNHRRLIGWDEILDGGLPPEAAVMSWRGTEGGITAARQFHDVIMSPGSHCYFDHYQADPATEPVAFGGLTTLEKVYSFEPVPAELNATEANHILGAQCNLWTEQITTPEHLQYMAYPRAQALAEVNWTAKKNRNWDDFTRRMKNQYPRLDLMKVNYRKEK
jgi:hexosaminidase